MKELKHRYESATSAQCLAIIARRFSAGRACIAFPVRLNLACLMIAVLISGCGHIDQSPKLNLSPFQFTRPEMGTVFSVTIYGESETAVKPAAEAAFARAEQLNSILSDYDPNSEISKLSRMTDAGPMNSAVHVSDDLWNMLWSAVEASRKSDGAFDITIGPCVKLWRRSASMGRLPSDELLAKARGSVGWQAIELNPEKHEVKLNKSNTRLDVGGIAKGYAAAEMLKIIARKGYTIASCGAAGDLAVGDAPPGKQHWRVAIASLQHPDQTDGYVKIVNASISTSGDTQRYIIIDGVRYSHIIDPRTGLGLTRRTGATVICKAGTNADWLCKPLCILGAEKGMKIIEATEGAAARMVEIETFDGKEKSTFHQSRDWAGFVDDPN